MICFFNFFSLTKITNELVTTNPAPNSVKMEINASGEMITSAGGNTLMAMSSGEIDVDNNTKLIITL